MFGPEFSALFLVAAVDAGDLPSREDTRFNPDIIDPIFIKVHNSLNLVHGFQSTMTASL